MGNSKDWEELEKWNNNHNEKIKKEYGDDVNNLNKKTKKTRKVIDKVNKVSNRIQKIFLTFCLLIIILAIFIFIKYMIGVREKVDVNVTDTLSKMYDVKIKIVSLSLDDKKNGTYNLETKKDPKIDFKAVKTYGSFNDDYSKNCLKYYFENWNSALKEKFKAEEKIDEDGLLDYKIYADINNFNDIDKIVDAYLEFKEYAKEYYFEDWPMLIRKDNFKTYIVTGTGYSEEHIRDILKASYVKWYVDYNKNFNDLNLSQSIIDKYYNLDINSLVN